MLKERATAEYNNGYNCAESVIRAANAEYNLGLSERDMKMMAGFGAGMGCGQACGALCGAIAAISAMKVETKAHECADLGPTCTAIVREFKSRLTDTQCKNIKAKFFNKENRCLHSVLMACESLEAVIG